MALPLSASKNFVTLVDVLRDMAIEFPALKGVVLAQWAYESGWGQSGLATKHQNYAGMKWGAVDREYGNPLQYGTAKYTEFTCASAFIHAYWHRLDHVGVFDGWRLRAGLADPMAFLAYITPGWLNGRAFAVPLTADERVYVANVDSIYRNRTAELFVPAEETDHEEDSGNPASA